MNNFLGGSVVLASNSTDRIIIGPFLEGDTIDEITLNLTGAEQTPVGVDPLVVDVRWHGRQPLDTAAAHANGEPLIPNLTIPGTPRVTDSATGKGVQVFNQRLSLPMIPVRAPFLWVSVQLTSTAAHAAISGNCNAKIFRRNPNAKAA